MQYEKVKSAQRMSESLLSVLRHIIVIAYVIIVIFISDEFHFYGYQTSTHTHTHDCNHICQERI